MTLYRIPLKIKSPLVTALKGDTIWGHFVWGIANHEGENAVSDFLKECDTENPPLIVSSAFPIGLICKPIPEVTAHKKISITDYSNIKKAKKQRYVSSHLFIKDDRESDSVNAFMEFSATHNSINRISNTVEEGELYSVNEMWPVETQDFELYVLSVYEKERVEQLAKWAFENGFGADTSVGKGNIEILGEPEVVMPSKSGRRYVALAPFIANEKIKKLRADTFIRSGKIGGTFASQISPFKKTVVLFDEGAVFESDEPLQFVGKLIKNVHADSRICQSGFAPVLPIE